MSSQGGSNANGTARLAGLRGLALPLLWLYLVALALVAIVGSLAIANGEVTIEAVFSDPVEATGSRLVGLISTAGLLVWAAAAAVCFLTAGLVRKGQPAERLLGSFFVASGLVTMMLLLDDFLAVHELGIDVAVWLANVERTRDMMDVTELIVFGLYAIVVVAYFWYFRGLLRRMELWLFGLAWALFAVSLAIDVFPIDDLLRRVVAPKRVQAACILAEEVPKLLGIITYLVFFARLAFARALASSPRGAQADT